jgi:hypothetical protein
VEIEQYGSVCLYRVCRESKEQGRLVKIVSRKLLGGSELTCIYVLCRIKTQAGFRNGHLSQLVYAVCSFEPRT